MLAHDSPEGAREARGRTMRADRMSRRVGFPNWWRPPPYSTLGPRAAAATGLPAGLPVAVGAGDGPLANLAVGTVRPGTAAFPWARAGRCG